MTPRDEIEREAFLSHLLAKKPKIVRRWNAPRKRLEYRDGRPDAYFGAMMDGWIERAALDHPPAPATEAKCPTCGHTAEECGAPHYMTNCRDDFHATPRAGTSEGEPIRWIACPNGDYLDERASTFDIEQEARHHAERVDGGDPDEVWGVIPLYARPTPPPAEGVEKALRLFTDAARAMMAAKRAEAANADYDNSLGLAVIQTTKAANRAYYDLINTEAAERAERETGGGGE